MKKVTVVLAAALALSATAAFAGSLAGTGVNGSVHDMTLQAGVTETYGRVCVFCHTPHNTTNTLDAAPLWNRNASTVASWQNYVWATPANQDPTMDFTDVLAGPTRLCMTCHDGSVAIDQHNSAGAMAGSTFLSGAKAIGASGNLTNDHPVGFDYTAAFLVRGPSELAAVTDKFATDVTDSAIAGNYNDVARLSNKTIGSVLYNSAIMTCASCHEVHNKNNAVQDVGVGGVTPNYLLYAKETKSLICLSCHLK